MWSNTSTRSSSSLSTRVSTQKMFWTNMQNRFPNHFLPLLHLELNVLMNAKHVVQHFLLKFKFPINQSFNPKNVLDKYAKYISEPFFASFALRSQCADELKTCGATCTSRMCLNFCKCCDTNSVLNHLLQVIVTLYYKKHRIDVRAFQSQQYSTFSTITL